MCKCLATLNCLQVSNENEDLVISAHNTTTNNLCKQHSYFYFLYSVKYFTAEP
uniref:Uncharacterized protein n=1 Tax=Anguilla anguilla TaxID=7936 RepID=A0A0E9RJP9_ANGAN